MCMCHLLPKMISIRQRFYETTEKTEQIFSRLTWKVESVDSLFGERVHSTDTNRELVGVFSQINMTFELRTLDSRFFNGFLPVSVSGQVTDNGQKRGITLDFKLGPTFFLFVVMFIYSISDVFFISDKTNPLLVLWIIFFPGIWTLLMKNKMDNMESKIKDLFGV